MQSVKFGVPKLKSIICGLRKMGYKINCEMVKGVLPTGKRIMYGIYTLEEQKHYKRGQRKPENAKTQEYNCKVGDDVWYNGKRVLVQEVLESGSESRKIKAYIKGCFYHSDGTPAERTNAFCGYDWVI
jgi:hypothetical protein